MTEPAQNLKEERIRQGLSLQDVFERTRISEGVLRDLEEGNFDRIGTPLLVRGFIRTYSSALGIDAEPILGNHAAEIVACDRQQDGIRGYRRFSLAVANKRRRWSVLATVLVVLVLGSIVTGAWIANRRTKLSMNQSMTNEVIPQEELPSDLPRTPAKTETPTPEPSKQPEQLAVMPTNKVVGPLPIAQIKERSLASSDNKPADVSESSTVQATAQKELKTEASTAARKAEQKSQEEVPLQASQGTEAEAQSEQKPALQTNEHVLSAAASQDVWIQVRVDNKNTYNALMKPGERREWKAQESMQIIIGNAGGLNLKWDGKPLRSLGKSGEVVRFKLPDPKYLEES